jgi:hypothetical protein
MIGLACSSPSIWYGREFRYHGGPMMRIRQWHSYIGLFIAPSVLFFALTGAAQLFSLHEAHGKYEPPAIIEKLSSVHKDQVFEFGDHHGQAAAADEHEDKSELSTLLLKAFFLLVACALALSTALGLWMGLTQMRRKPVAWMLVAAGTLIPIVLLAF